VVEMENNGGIMVVLPLFPFLFLIFRVFIFCFYYSFSLASVFLIPCLVFPSLSFFLYFPLFLSSSFSSFVSLLFLFFFFSLFFLSVHLLKSPPFCVSPSYIYKGERKGGRKGGREREPPYPVQSRLIGRVVGQLP